MNTRKCDVCNIVVHRASYVKQFKSKIQLEMKSKIKCLYQDACSKNLLKMKPKNKPKSLKQIARDNIRLEDKQLNKELAKKMINPYYFTDEVLKVGFKINLDAHNFNLANSKLTITHNYPELRYEVRYINKIIKKLSVIYAISINQYKFKHQTVFSPRFDKQEKNDQVLDETVIFVNLKFIQNFTEMILIKLTLHLH